MKAEKGDCSFRSGRLFITARETSGGKSDALCDGWDMFPHVHTLLLVGRAPTAVDHAGLVLLGPAGRSRNELHRDEGVRRTWTEGQREQEYCRFQERTDMQDSTQPVTAHRPVVPTPPNPIVLQTPREQSYIVKRQAPWR